MDHLELLKRNAQKIIDIGKKHGAFDLKVFGSVARGDYEEKSDFDFIYTLGETSSPWFPGGFVMDLENLLGKKVDVASEKYLKERLRDQILSEAIPLCELIKKD